MPNVPFRFMMSPSNWHLFDHHLKLTAVVDDFVDLVELSPKTQILNEMYSENVVVASPYNAYIIINESDILIAVTNFNAVFQQTSLFAGGEFPNVQLIDPPHALNVLNWAVNGGLKPTPKTYDHNSNYIMVDKRILHLGSDSEEYKTILENSVAEYLMREETRMDSAQESGVNIELFGPRPPIEPNYVFAIMPFSASLTDVYDLAIKSVLQGKPLKLRVERADEIYSTGYIIKQIWNSIAKARFIVADMTGRNPNVMYELGIAHALGKTVIMITQEIDDIPFDLRHLRLIKYSKEPREFEKLKADLKTYATNIIDNKIDVSIG